MGVLTRCIACALSVACLLYELRVQVAGYCTVLYGYTIKTLPFSLWNSLHAKGPCLTLFVNYIIGQSFRLTFYSMSNACPRRLTD